MLKFWAHTFSSGPVPNPGLVSCRWARRVLGFIVSSVAQLTPKILVFHSCISVSPDAWEAEADWPWTESCSLKQLFYSSLVMKSHPLPSQVLSLYPLILFSALVLAPGRSPVASTFLELTVIFSHCLSQTVGTTWSLVSSSQEPLGAPPCVWLLLSEFFALYAISKS